jgi:hypothetical protein
MPELVHEPEEAVRVGPARLYVGQGSRLAPPGGEPEGGEARASYFVAELRLPRPEDGLPFGLTAKDDEPDPWSEELELEGAELSDPGVDDPDLAGAFTLDLDATEAPDPPAFFLPPPPDAEPGPPGDANTPGPAQVALQPSPAREPLARRVRATPTERAQAGPTPAKPPAPAAPPALAEPPLPAPPPRPAPTAVIHSKPSWTRARPLPAPTAAPAPQFQTRDEPLPNPWVQRLVSWPTLVVLVAVLVAATALLVRGLLST